METIRKGTFETNSSSTHSICICTEERHIHIPKEIEIALTDYNYEFGWENVIWYTAEDKLAYLILCILGVYDPISFMEVAERMKRLLEQLHSIGVKHVAITGIEAHIYEGKPYWSHGESYVDHASEAEDFVQACLSDTERLKKFLFCYDSYIKGGNDNDDEISEIHENYQHEEFFKGN